MNMHQVATVLLAVTTLVFVCGCAATDVTKGRNVMTYEIRKAGKPVPVDGAWDGPAWHDVKPLTLRHYMGDRPEHFPRTQAKLLYDESSVHVIFRVEDQYVRAVARKHQDAVCLDSCVEFFFTPNEEAESGYFNLEMNCGGTLLFHYQVVPRKGTRVSDEDLEKIEVAAHLPGCVDPEITDSTIWTVQYRLPVAILDRYADKVVKPGPGVVWRANFYKCGDETSHPHWLTWAEVDRPRPDFHVPESFGRLIFK